MGGCLGGILAGVVSDKMGKRATTCAVMLLLAAPTVCIITALWRKGMYKNKNLYFSINKNMNIDDCWFSTQVYYVIRIKLVTS